MKANKEIDGDESEDLIGIKAGDAIYEVYKLFRCLTSSLIHWA